MVIITKALGLVYKIPLANILGGTGMGYFSAAFSLFTPVYAAACAGIPSAMARLTAENAALGRYSNVRRLKRSAFIIFGTISLVACAGVVLLSQPLERYAVRQNGVAMALVCLAPSVVFCSLMNVERGYCEGLSNMLPTALSEIAETVFKIALGLGAAVFVRNMAENSYHATSRVFGIACASPEQAHNAALPFIAAAAILGSTAASGIACLFLVVGVRIRGDGITPKMLASDPVTDSFGRTKKVLLQLAVPIASAAVITTLTGMLDMLTMQPCLARAYEKAPEYFQKYLEAGVAEDKLSTFLYGSYEGLAVLIYGLVPTLTAMFGKSVLPSLADSRAKNDIECFRRNVENMLRISSMIAIPSGLGIMFMSEPILKVLFSGRSAEIEAAKTPLAILGAAAVFFSLCLPCFTVLQTLGKPMVVSKLMILGGAVKAGLNMLLIPVPSLNLKGSAAAELISVGLVCVLTLREVSKLTGGIRRKADIYVKPAYAALMCAVSARTVYDRLKCADFPHIHEVFALSLAIFVSVIIYGISLYLLCETPKNVINAVFLKKSQKNT